MNLPKNVDDLIEKLIDHDAPVDDLALVAQRQRLVRQIRTMEVRSRRSRMVIVGGIISVLLGYMLLGVIIRFDLKWPVVFAIAYVFLFGGALIAVVAAIGYFLFHGRNYYNARNDLRDAAIADLMTKMDKLAAQVTEITKRIP